MNPFLSLYRHRPRSTLQLPWRNYAARPSSTARRLLLAKYEHVENIQIIYGLLDYQ
jgi:hypothetical protein